MNPDSPIRPSLLADLVALGRYDQPIGTWLLAWPCCWGVALAQPSLRSLFMLCGVFLVGAALARAGGCAWNDLMDRRLDAAVARTRNRPLAAGRIRPATALVYIGVHIAAAGALLTFLPAAAVWLIPASLPLVALYPLAKRFTWLPQLWLGVTFNWGALVGWSAATGAWPALGALLLYVGAVAWTMGYDTLYAYQDRTDDLTVGIGSTAARLGAHGRRFVVAAYGVAIVLFACALGVTDGGLFGWLGLAGFGLMLARQAANVNLDEPTSCGAAFRAAHPAAFVWFAGLAADIVLAQFTATP